MLAIARAIPLACITLFCITACLVTDAAARTYVTKLQACARWTHRWYFGAARIMGIRVNVTGTIPRGGALVGGVVAPNHLGYADILAIGSIIPCFFVAKIDVESWPIVGFLFRSSRHIGVPRARAKGIVAAADAIADRLRNGNIVCVFLEGTSTGGDTVRPFHGSMLQPAIDIGAPAIPTSLQWRIDRPGLSVAEDVAYWKDHEFISHLWRLLGLRGISVTIHFGDPLKLDPDRKTAAIKIREKVLTQLQETKSPPSKGFQGKLNAKKSPFEGGFRGMSHGRDIRPISPILPITPITQPSFRSSSSSSSKPVPVRARPCLSVSVRVCPCLSVSVRARPCSSAKKQNLCPSV